MSHTVPLEIDERMPWPAAGGAASAREARWLLDRRRAKVEFVVTRLWGLRKVRGEFSLHGGVVDLRRSSAEPEIDIRIAATSVLTHDPERDELLRSAAFLDASAHPEIRFLAAAVSARSGTELQLSGELRLAGRVVPVQASAGVVRVDDDLDVVVRTTLGYGQLGLGPARLDRGSSRLTVIARARMLRQRLRD
jgi:polyisoprenoid-binding protein YceI